LFVLFFLKLLLQGFDDQQKRLKQQIAAQEKKVAESMADKKRVKAMEAAVEEKRKSYNAATETAAKVEARVQKVHSKIMELTEGKMCKAREKLDAVNNQITKV
jgi:uncharacterized protein YdaU (DUF1376 family)